ncbi:hypothetical protein H0E87_028911, partial [Populus deltoides]
MEADRGGRGRIRRCLRASVWSTREAFPCGAGSVGHWRAAAAALGGGDGAPAGMGSGCAEGKKIDEEGDEAVNLFGLGLLAEGDDEEDGLKWLGGSDVGQLWRGEGNGETAWRRKICRGRLKRKQNRKSNKETGGAAAALEEKKIRTGGGGSRWTRADPPVPEGFGVEHKGGISLWSWIRGPPGGRSVGVQRPAASSEERVEEAATEEESGVVLW